MRTTGFVSPPLWLRQWLSNRQDHYQLLKKAWLVVRHAARGTPTEPVWALQAEAALAAGDHDVVRRYATRLLKGRSALGYYYQAQSKFLLAEYDAAIKDLHRLLAALPGHADGSFLLADALTATCRREEAWQLLERLGRSSKRVKTWIVMANLVNTREDFLRLHERWNVWIASDASPGFHPHAYECLALAAVRGGDYATARSIWQETMYRAATRAGGFSGLEKKTVSYSARRAERALLDLQHTFDTAETEMFLVSGTLLGCMREGRLLPHDKDIDVGVWDGVDRGRLLLTIRRSGRFYVQAGRWPNILRLKHVSGIGVDVFTHVRETNDYWHGGGKVIWHNTPFGLSRHAFLGRSFLVPADYDKYLTENYGDWRTPKLVFDSSYDTPNREVISEEEMALHAYKALMGALTRGNLNRADFYLDRLRDHGDTVFVDAFRKTIRHKAGKPKHE